MDTTNHKSVDRKHFRPAQTKRHRRVLAAIGKGKETNFITSKANCFKQYKPVQILLSEIIKK